MCVIEWCGERVESVLCCEKVCCVVIKWEYVVRVGGERVKSFW